MVPLYEQLPQDETLFAAASDIVWRFHAHAAYGKKAAGALRALAKRVPGHPKETYKDVFELCLQRLNETVAAVNAAPKVPKPGQLYSDYADVNLDFVMERLRASFPGYPDEFLQADIGMVINWYYLR